MNKGILITIKKELRSVFRDKKTLRNMFIIPLFIPVMVFLIGYLSDNEENNTKKYDVGVNYELTEYEKKSFEELHIISHKYDTEEELQKQYKDKEISAYITYNKEDNEYVIYTDKSQDGLSINSILEQHFDGYNNYLANEYLVKHNINVEEAFNNFKLENKELENKENYLTKTIYSMVIMYIIMAITIATASMATSTTATERENGTLETILTFPVKSKDLITGKYLATAIVGAMASLFAHIITITSMAIAIKTFKTYSDLTLSINPISLILSIVIIVLASLFIAAIALILTIYSKSYKEAQSSTGSLSLLCIIPYFVSMMNVEITPVYYLIPIFNYNNILMEVLSNNITWTYVLMTIISTIVLIGVVLKYIFKTYSSEKVLFMD